MTTLRSTAPLLISAALAGGCVDLSPLPYDGAPTVILEASTADVVYDVGGPDSPSAACVACLKVSCRSAEVACEANTKCSKFSACMTATNCWGSSLLDPSHLAPCIIQCGASSGLLSQTDPAAALLTPIFTCTGDPNVCGMPCQGSSDQ
jgi:hypothetical protein